MVNKQLALLMVCTATVFCGASENYEMVVEKRIGISSYQNKRDYQEDRFYHGTVDGGNLYAVYDGHGNDKVAHFLAENFHHYFGKTSGPMRERMVEAFKNADNDEFVQLNKKSGSTASVVYIKDNVAHFAHVGDSRALLEKDGCVAFATQDHKPMRPDEEQRIENAGGCVYQNRVNGCLAVSRAFGDYDVGKNLIISEPEYAEIPLTNNHGFLVVASDGLWDKMSNEEVAAMLQEKRSSIQDMSLLAKMLVLCVVQRGVLDNITVMLIDLLS